MRYEKKKLEIFVAHRLELVNYAGRIVGDAGLAEDVVQEAYLRFNAAPQDHLLEKPVGYLYRIVHNLAIDGRRRTARETQYVQSSIDIDAVQIAEERPSPEDAVASKDEMRLVLAAMSELPARTRIALEMHCFGGEKLKAISQHLDISIGLAHRLVVDGLEHCRARRLKMT